MLINSLALSKKLSFLDTFLKLIIFRVLNHLGYIYWFRIYSRLTFALSAKCKYVTLESRPSSFSPRRFIEAYCVNFSLNLAFFTNPLKSHPFLIYLALWRQVHCSHICLSGSFAPSFSRFRPINTRTKSYHSASYKVGGEW